MKDNEQMIDTGDTVKHLPSGETWTVACVQGNDLSWCGWPEGMARTSDCELIEKATPEYRLKLLRDLADISTHDHRRSYARWRLEQMGQGVEVDTRNDNMNAVGG